MRDRMAESNVQHREVLDRHPSPACLLAQVRVPVMRTFFGSWIQDTALRPFYGTKRMPPWMHVCFGYPVDGSRLPLMMAYL
jgi:hypothetical protein